LSAQTEQIHGNGPRRPATPAGPALGGAARRDPALGDRAPGETLPADTEDTGAVPVLPSAAAVPPRRPAPRPERGAPPWL
jgi:hypothetical protein